MLREIASKKLSDLDLPTPLIAGLHASVEDIATSLREAECSAIAIVSDTGALRAVVSERDLLASVIAGRSSWEQAIGELIRKDPVVLRHNDTVARAINLVDDCNHVAVVDAEGKLMGLISPPSLLSHLVDLLPTSLLQSEPPQVEFQL